MRVALPAGTSIDGFVPRASTGFQVKKPDMPRAAIIDEMRPAGVIRPVIQELADGAGAYIIVSSNGSTADSALSNRTNALRKALNGVANADRLHTDFYDRTRVAAWVRCHPGVVVWVKEKVGRAYRGWRPYGAWSGAAEDVGAEYLVDDKLRLRVDERRDAPARPVAEAIDALRDMLAPPGKIVRLVGLSGVGKTRLVQALFDERIGERPLPRSPAVYTNMNDDPDPQPTGLASDLIASRLRAILIVDNCGPDLHRSLSELCAALGSTLSVLTVEYDVRDDQPEGTRVVTLDTSSPELIEKLVSRRYPHLSQVDARTIARVSDGNARVAIALAETVGRSETIAGLSDDALFQRLFHQRNAPDDALLRAAQACALVYSFQGEALTGDEAELPRLAVLADLTAREVYRHVGELMRRDLVQRRGVWRAVLPHAIANRLAARALEDTPADLVVQQLVTEGTERLARSFSRRLSYLHDSPHAVAIIERWLASGGLLGDVATLNHLGEAMLENVAPVSPEAALAALERVGGGNPAVAAETWHRHRSLLRSLAYDAALFERSVALLARAATESADERTAKEASETVASLFTLYLSGTRASAEQRLGVAERLLRSEEARARALGLAVLGKMLEATHFSSVHDFEFGGRSRDYGYRPRSRQDVVQWYGAALSFIARLALDGDLLRPELSGVLARNFRGLWTSAGVHDELEALARRFAQEGFWREGWAACRQTMRYDRDRMPPDVASRLAALEAELRPSNLSDRVRGVVLGDRSGGLDLEDIEVEQDVQGQLDRLEAIARDLGAAVAADEAVFNNLLPDVLRGGNKVWAFGRGLASGSEDPRALWVPLVGGLEEVPVEQRNLNVLKGFLAELWEDDRDLAQDLLDEVLEHTVLAAFAPDFHSAVQLDARGVARLMRALDAGHTPLWRYRNLAGGRTTDALPGGELRALLLRIADEPEGVDVAMEILSMRLYSDRTDRREHDAELLEAGRELLTRVRFNKDQQYDVSNVTDVARACLVEPDAAAAAAELVGRLRRAVASYETYSGSHVELVRTLLAVQPVAVLDALVEGEMRDRSAAIRMIDDLADDRPEFADVISSADLVAWCDRDPAVRYPFAAAIVPFARRAEENAPRTWADQAAALLANAPDPASVLAVLVDRFRPTGWSGSRAALMEANARLLDDLDLVLAANLAPVIAEAKARLAREIAAERRWEAEHDRERDERFE